MSKSPPPSIELNMSMSPLHLPNDDNNKPCDDISMGEHVDALFLPIEDMEEDNSYSVQKRLCFSPGVNSSSPITNNNDLLLLSMDDDGDRKESKELSLETQGASASNDNTTTILNPASQNNLSVVIMDDNDILKLIRKLETYRDDLRMISVYNAEIMDSLIMTGCVEL